MVKASWTCYDLGKSTGAEVCVYDFDARWHATGDCLAGKCFAGRGPPLHPDAFAAELERKGFTNGRTDRPRVSGLYRDTFAARLGSCTDVYFGGLRWGDAEVEQLAALIAAGTVPRLEVLALYSNRVGDAGVAALARALASGAVPELQVLMLGGNPFGDEGVARVAEALGALPKLRRLYLNDTALADEGAARLAEALAVPGAVPELEALRRPQNGAATAPSGESVGIRGQHTVLGLGLFSEDVSGDCGLQGPKTARWRTAR